MIKIYSLKNLSFFALIMMLFAFEACKKNSPQTTTPAVATPTKLGVYALSDTVKDTITKTPLVVDTNLYRELGMVVSKIGTQAIPDSISLLVYDTGSGGMVIDAHYIVPTSTITSNGFNFTGDSTVVNGITITNQTSVIAYGADAATEDKVYGNLAYASVTIGDENGNIVVKRLPFFLYYKAVDSKGNTYDPHEFDVFGVSSEYDQTFANSVNITSPFSYFDPGNGLTKGFKMTTIGTSDYSYFGTFVNAITLGLTSSDLSSSSGFNFSTLSFYQGDGYAPYIQGTVTYNGTAFSSYVLFDTGTEPYSYLEDPNFTGTGTTLLASGSKVSLSTTSGFSYSYTTTPLENLTNVENPGSQSGWVTIFSLDFFFNNEYLLDYTDHKLGVKNN
ncbi:hypothetical protein HDF24_12835 [Mucilaginibacter sp. X4EP1]|uniref:hypothetical protein n=1 Tax=Mucilaginibacter sp. X4EP1 TaxID=2723092 RepID=UPI002168118C|nr:hypothetical protein [Mucilaginibacter sp. X4EP1]